jgi:hypothetical protein
MVRTTVSNPQLAGTPLDELKQFLSITVTRDDAVLESLLQADAGHKAGKRRLGSPLTRFRWNQRSPGIKRL